MATKPCQWCPEPYNDHGQLESRGHRDCYLKFVTGKRATTAAEPDKFEPMAAPEELTNWKPGQRKVCTVCVREFTQIEPNQTTHKACSGRVNRGVASNPKQPETPYKDAGYTPGAKPPTWHAASDARSPLRVGVFDLETFALDRGWGLLLVGNVLVFGDGDPKEYRFRLDQFETYKRDRSDDSEIAAAIFSVLEECHVWYAHNGKWFDVPYLNSIALRYGMPPVERKLRDPVQILRAKFRIGSNSLEAAADFLGLERSKMHVPSEVWRQAAFNGSKEHFDTLEARCASDVALLTEVAGRVEAWGGVIDYSGFFRR
jgi:DNA polymerase III epsilon subunit-like protein